MSPATQINSRTIVAGSRSFRSAQAFRVWLTKNHDRVPELSIRCFKVEASHLGMTYREGLDEALCFGWIDGVRGGLDEKSFSVRFTPRRAKSRWSAVNIRRATELEREGRMSAPGLAAFRARLTAAYSLESRERKFPRALMKEFRSHPRAWTYYQGQSPWYRRVSAFWVLSAKKSETRARRFAHLIASSDQRRPVGPLSRKKR